ncbi:hypothetical protein HGRIS_010551 [Hohenbuehelia grisea]
MSDVDNTARVTSPSTPTSVPPEFSDDNGYSSPEIPEDWLEISDSEGELDLGSDSDSDSGDSTYSADNGTGSIPNKYLTLTIPPSDIEGARDPVECLLTESAKAQLLALPGFPRDPPTTGNSSRYRLKSSPSQHGLVTTKAMRAGDLVLSERPMVILPRSAKEASLATIIAQLSQKKQKDYRSLLYNEDSDSKASGVLRFVMATKGYPITLEKDDDSGGNYRAVFSHLSHAKHSCSPNTVWHWNSTTLSMQLYAVRNVAKDEEITLQRLLPVSIEDVRSMGIDRADIMRQCPACGFSFMSGARRTAIAELFEKHSRLSSVMKWSKDPKQSDDQLLKPILGCLNLIYTEGLESDATYAPMLMQAFFCFVALGNEAMAVRYGEQLGRTYMAEHDGDRSALEKYSDAGWIKKQSLWGARFKIAKSAPRK